MKMWEEMSCNFTAPVTNLWSQSLQRLKPAIDIWCPVTSWPDEHLWSPAHWTPLKHVVDCMSGTIVLRDSLVCLKLTIIYIFKGNVKVLIWWKFKAIFLFPSASIWNVETSPGLLCVRGWRWLKLQLDED